MRQLIAATECLIMAAVVQPLILPYRMRFVIWKGLRVVHYTLAVLQLLTLLY